MGLEIRAARPDELEDYLRVVRYLFAAPPASAGEDHGAKWDFDPSRTICAFVDGQLVSTHGSFPLHVRLNGALAAMAGVTNVGTLPGFRGRGLVRELVSRGLGAARDAGESCTMLWASFAAIYQRFGYGLASAHATYRWDPRYALLTGPPARGSTRIVSMAEGRETVERLHAEYVRPRNLMVERASWAWDWTYDPPPYRPRYQRTVIYEDEHHEPRGSMFVTNREQEDDHPGPNQYLGVRDLQALDADAHRRLWEFLASHDLVREVTMEQVAEDDPAALIMAEPRALRRRPGDAIWMRVADAELALAQRPYSASGVLTIAVVDALCDWNRGIYRIETRGSETEITRTSGEADLALPVERLAQLLSGYASPGQLARMGLLDAPDRRVLATVDALFRTGYRPFCQEEF